MRLRAVLNLILGSLARFAALGQRICYSFSATMHVESFLLGFLIGAAAAAAGSIVVAVALMLRKKTQSYDDDDPIVTFYRFPNGHKVHGRSVGPAYADRSEGWSGVGWGVAEGVFCLFVFCTLS